MLPPKIILYSGFSPLWNIYIFNITKLSTFVKYFIEVIHNFHKIINISQSYPQFNQVIHLRLWINPIEVFGNMCYNIYKLKERTHLKV